jgi:hypothetical protein
MKGVLTLTPLPPRRRTTGQTDTLGGTEWKKEWPHFEEEKKRIRVC